MKATGLDTGASSRNVAVKTMATRGAEKAPAAAKGQEPPAIKPVQTTSVGLGSKPSTSTQTFKQAYAAARAAAKPGEDPNKMQFKWTNPKTGKEGVYQSAATKKDYVPMSQQTKVDIGSSKPDAATAPAAAPKPEADVKASVSTAQSAPAPEKAPEPAPKTEPGYTPGTPAAKAYNDSKGKFVGTQQENKMVAESFVSVGENKYRIV